MSTLLDAWPLAWVTAFAALGGIVVATVLAVRERAEGLRADEAKFPCRDASGEGREGGAS